jgi:hypothetical protein
VAVAQLAATLAVVEVARSTVSTAIPVLVLAAVEAKPQISTRSIQRSPLLALLRQAHLLVVVEVQTMTTAQPVETRLDSDAAAAVLGITAGPAVTVDLEEEEEALLESLNFTTAEMVGLDGLWSHLWAPAPPMRCLHQEPPTAFRRALRP